MGVRVNGLKRMKKALEKIGPKTNKAIDEIIAEMRVAVIKEARTKHRYRSRSGNLARATKSTYSKKKRRARFYIDKRLTGVAWRGRVMSYGVFQHDGTRHIKADHFLLGPFKKYAKIATKKLKKLPREIGL